MIRKVMLLGEPVLMQEALNVKDFGSARLRALVADLWDTMRAEGGIGIAAPQIGVSEQVICLGSDEPGSIRSKMVPATVLINPTLKLLADDPEDWEDGWEGCLSVPGMRGVVRRAKRVLYSAYTLEGEKFERTVEGFHARVVQHEFDHLKGIVYPMRIEDWTKFGFTEALESP